MPPWRRARPYVIFAALPALVYTAMAALIGWNQRRFIYFPTHDSVQTPLRPWMVSGQIIGYCRTVENPRTVWLMTHGNGGQAGYRAYVLKHMSERDSLYVLEYPGYGQRTGNPSRASFDRAATEAYQVLQRDFPRTPIGVIGESIGSGPASFLATLEDPPAKLVLIVPFDSLASVASEAMPLLPVRALLKDDWDNVAALAGYSGPVDIYGATDDQIIKFQHAQNLAARVRQAKFVAIPGGHNDWSDSDLVRIEK